MEEYLRRDWQLREKVREEMAQSGVGYENYGKMRGKLADGGDTHARRCGALLVPPVHRELHDQPFHR